MTALLTAPTTGTWTIGAPRLLAGLDRYEFLDLTAHSAVHGPLPALGLVRLLGLLDGAALAGRGGAGFPFAAKLRALPPAGPREVVVNGAESEPGSTKDRTLLRRAPHLVLDGAITVARATGARRITVVLHDPLAEQAVRRAAAERRERIRITPIDGGFVAGEGRAVVRALTGGPARPPGRRAHAAQQGVVLANVETFAQLAVLARLGAAYRNTGTAAEPGTTLLTVGGAVARPGVVEIPLGTPLDIILDASAAAPPQAIVVGGYHGSWHARAGDITLSRAGMANVGGTFGAGVLLVIDHSTCALGELARVAAWLAAESVGQCGPCRFGLPAIARDVAALADGVPAGLGAAFAHARVVDGRGACRHPDGAVRFVTSGLHLLRDEVARHARGGCGRPVHGLLPIGERP
jgi:NADH:ubiquinone oxidoreductase subunit F (NADH-binding)